MNNFDIIIIGAGASGLVAAAQLSKAGKKVAILDARDRIGGRIHTYTPFGFGFHIEEGAEFVHGDLPITKKLLKSHHIAFHAIEGEMWRTHDGQLAPESHDIRGFDRLDKELKKLKQDISVEEFLQKYFAGEEYEELRLAVQGFVEGFDTGEISTASVYKFRDEWMEMESEGNQYRIDGGYLRLAEALQDDCVKKGAEIYLASPITEVNWKRGNVQVVDKHKNVYTAQKVLVTVPLSILQSETFTDGAIQFTPPVAEKLMAARQLGFGYIIKILLQFNTSFWEKYTMVKEKPDMGFFFSDTPIPTWWTQLPKDIPLLTGWVGGPKAKDIMHLSTGEILNLAIGSLGSAFGLSENELRRNLVASHVANWNIDPFTRGAYTFATVNAQQYIDQLKQPVERTIYFAGEAIYNGDDTGTVEAALSSGIEVSTIVLNDK